MTALPKIASGVVTALLLAWAIAIGGGHPLSPARVADSTRAAARNASEAEENTTKAARATRALGTIAENVDSQVRSSERMLAIQLRLERSSRDGAARSRDLQEGIDDVRVALLSIRSDVSDLAELSERTVAVGVDAAAAGDEIRTALERLEARFEEVVDESRRLNRKARGYQELREGPR